MFLSTRQFAIALIAALLCAMTTSLRAWEGMAMPRLHIDGKHLKDENGNIVKLHGYVQTFSPWFNECGTRWNNYDVKACLAYNQGIIDGIMAAGWKMSFVRMHMDPYWSNIVLRGRMIFPPSVSTGSPSISTRSLSPWRSMPSVKACMW